MPLIDLFANIFMAYLAYRGWCKVREWFIHRDEYVSMGKEKISSFIQEEIRKGVEAELQRMKEEKK